MSLPLQRWNLNSPYCQEDGDWVKSEGVAALEAEVERLRELTKMYLSDCKEWIDELNEVKRQRDELRALLREVSSELIYGRHPAQGEHHLAGKVRAALGEEVK